MAICWKLACYGQMHGCYLVCYQILTCSLPKCLRRFPAHDDSDYGRINQDKWYYTGGRVTQRKLAGLLSALRQQQGGSCHPARREPSSEPGYACACPFISHSPKRWEINFAMVPWAGKYRVETVHLYGTVWVTNHSGKHWTHFLLPK